MTHLAWGHAVEIRTEPGDQPAFHSQVKTGGWKCPKRRGQRSGVTD
jgi:hypothetical protein